MERSRTLRPRPSRTEYRYCKGKTRGKGEGQQKIPTAETKKVERNSPSTVVITSGLDVGVGQKEDRENDSYDIPSWEDESETSVDRTT